MFARVFSLGLLGLDAFAVEVEADISQGLPKFDIVGLPDASVTESRDRVRAAMKNCGFTFPVSRITVNLAPADVRKEGSVYDLPVLIALLSASNQLKADTDSAAFLGELSLDGTVRPVKGVLPMAITAKQLGYKAIYVPEQNGAEASAIEGIDVYGIDCVSTLLRHLRGECVLSPLRACEALYGTPDTCGPDLDFSDVKGQQDAKRALEIAAAGGHNIILIGSPGSGKSMLAKRLPTILPQMTLEESMECTKLHSIAGTLPESTPLIRQRPFRSPHHTVSPAGLSGGGTIPKPGEISLAHNGVLFLDELPEFSRGAMEVLRQPMEDGKVTISRAAGTLSYPCTVMLVCAMNPCPCGYFGHPTRPCTCASGSAAKYLSRVSGPLLDRLDIHVEVPPVDFQHLSSDETAETSAQIRERVNAARKIQQERFAGTGISCNARMTANLVRQFCAPVPEALALLEQSFDALGLSARAYDKILKVSRTIADLEGSERVTQAHIAEAIQYRSLDRKYWNA